MQAQDCKRQNVIEEAYHAPYYRLSRLYVESRDPLDATSAFACHRAGDLGKTVNTTTRTRVEPVRCGCRSAAELNLADLSVDHDTKK